MKFGERLKKAREFAKLSQGELAQLAGISQKTISKIELGKQHRSTQMVALAAACNVRAEWLSNGHGPMELSSNPSSMYDPTAGTAGMLLSTEALALARMWDEATDSVKATVRHVLVTESALREALNQKTVAPREKEYPNAHRDRLVRAIRAGEKKS
jgi:transcriptional regulator with XRE-family HTH domain